MRPFTLLLTLVCCQAAYGQSSILIEANAPGHGARAVEQAVLAPLEDFLDGAEGVQRMRGLAWDGKCLIQLDLTAKADPELVRTLVQNRVRLAKTALPPVCTTKILPPADGAFMLFSLTSDTMSLADTSELAKKTVWPRLAGVPGVASIQLIGAAEQGVRITLNPDRLRACNLAAGDVVAVVQNSRKNFDGLSFHGKRVALWDGGGGPADLGNLPILPEKSFYLRDVASVEEATETRQDARVFQGTGKVLGMKRAVFVLVQLAPGKLHPTAKQALEKAATALRAKMPEGIRFEARPLQANDTTVVMRLPEGTDREGAMDKAEAAVKVMMELPQVRTLFWIAQPAEREVICYVVAEAGKQADLPKSLRAKLAKIEGTHIRVGGLVSPLVPWPGQGSQFVARLQGKDSEKLRKTAELLATRLAKTPGIVDIDHFPRLRQQLAVTIDRERMGLAGVQPADIARAFRFLDPQPVLGWPWPITIAVSVPVAKTAAEVGMSVIHSNAGKPATLLRDVATTKMIAAPNGILHEGGRPCVTVFANVEGRIPEEACAAIRRLAQELAGKGIEVEVECQGKTIPGAPAQPGPADKNEQKPMARVIEPTPVTTVVPKRITLTLRIEQPGYVKSLESTPIYCKIAGFAKEWRVDIGDYVKKDELLVKLFIPEVLQDLRVKEARVKQAEAELKQAKENVSVAKAAEDAAKARMAQAEAVVESWSAEVSRAKDLLKKAKNDQATVDKIVKRWTVSKAAKDACDADWREKSALRAKRLADVEVADAQLQVSKAAYQQWKDWAAYAEVKAPFDGIITLRNVSTGDFVQPPSSGAKNTAAPLFIVERYDIMRVIIQVPEMDARAVKKGDKAAFSVQALPRRDLIGAVTRHAFALDENSRTLRVECDLPNADKKLRPGMFVSAVIIGKIDNAWVLPESAVRNDILADGDIRYCFQVVKGVARRLNLEVGLSGAEGVEVLRKQEPGSKRWVDFSGQEMIVANPAGLSDGQAVAPKMAEPKKKE